MGIKDNFDKALKKGIRKAALEKGAPSEVDFKQMLKNSKDIEIDKEEEVDEATGAASAGGYVGPLFTSIKKKKSNKEEMEEATDGSSSGAYETPKMWAKDKKNWKPAAKTQWPGGKFVKIKDKCKTFPYCNQGDINALELTENKTIKKAIEEISKKTGKDKEHIKNLVTKEIEEIINRSFYKSPVTDKDSGIVGVGKMDTPIGKMYSIGGKNSSK